MLVTVYTNNPENPRTQEVPVGANLTGQRLLALRINSQKDLDELLTADGILWAKRSLRFMRPAWEPKRPCADEDMLLTTFGKL